MIRYLKAAWFITTAFTLTAMAFSSICVARFFNLLGLPANYQEYAHRVACFWGQSMFYLTPGWNIEVFGRENLTPTNKPVIYVANHQSNADIWIVLQIVAQPVRADFRNTLEVFLKGTSSIVRRVCIDHGIAQFQPFLIRPRCSDLSDEQQGHSETQCSVLHDD